MKREALQLLLVDDSPADIRITERAFKQSSHPVSVCSFKSAEEALSWLRSSAEQAGVPPRKTPDIILLDIQMPEMTGLDFLEIIKRDPELKRIPVVMLTSSKNSSDVEKSYQFGAAGFIQKPVSYEEFCQVIEGFIRYWIDINVLPEEENRHAA